MYRKITNLQPLGVHFGYPRIMSGSEKITEVVGYRDTRRQLQQYTPNLDFAPSVSCVHNVPCGLR